MSATDPIAALTDKEVKKIIEKPIVKSQDMVGDMPEEAKDLIVSAIDKFSASSNWEAAASKIKQDFDKKFAPTWHCVIGEGFGFDVTYQQKHMIYIFHGNIGILCYKC